MGGMPDTGKERYAKLAGHVADRGPLLSAQVLATVIVGYGEILSCCRGRSGAVKALCTVDTTGAFKQSCTRVRKPIRHQPAQSSRQILLIDEVGGAHFRHECVKRNESLTQGRAKPPMMRGHA